MAKRELTRDDLLAHFSEQLQFLKLSAASFDQGFESEAKRLAVTMRLLLRDGTNPRSQSKSLLKQLELKDQMFHDTSTPAVEGAISDQALIVGMLATVKGGKYVAPLAEAPIVNWVKFEEWWESPVYIGTNGDTLSRRDFVSISTDQDGGAHVDSALDERYARVVKDFAHGFESFGPDGVHKLTGIEAVAIRQIAHEVLVTLDKDYVPPKLEFEGVLSCGFSITIADDVPEEQLSTPLRTRLGRNEACPCGSGLRFKRCHGSLA